MKDTGMQVLDFGSWDLRVAFRCAAAPDGENDYASLN
jgi:hypothetical protein